MQIGGTKETKAVSTDSVVRHVVETESHVDLTWNKTYSRRFPKLQPDHGVGLISQHVTSIIVYQL